MDRQTAKTPAGFNKQFLHNKVINYYRMIPTVWNHKNTIALVGSENLTPHYNMQTPDGYESPFHRDNNTT